MPLTLSFEEGKFYPVVLCDYCAGLIQQNGNAEFVYDFNNDPTGLATEVFFTHKGGCSTGLRKAKGGTKWVWYELTSFLLALQNNTITDMQRAKEVALWLDSINL